MLLDGRRCVGVVYEHQGRTIEARAGREVILSAGAVATPQLLELSGIGRPDVLKSHGIGVVHALPAVGENLRDHIAARLVWRVKDPRVSYNHKARGLGAATQALKYAATGGGFFGLPSAPLVAFLKTRPELATPDIQLHLVPFSVKDPKQRKLQDFPSMIGRLLPAASRRAWARSTSAPPIPTRSRRSASTSWPTASTGAPWSDGFRIARRIVETRAMDHLRGEEFLPGKDVETDEQIIDWLRNNAQTAYHPIGTCRMGQGPNTVVDERLRVHGLAGPARRRRLGVSDHAVGQHQCAVDHGGREGGRPDPRQRLSRLSRFPSLEPRHAIALLPQYS